MEKHRKNQKYQQIKGKKEASKGTSRDGSKKKKLKEMLQEIVVAFRLATPKDVAVGTAQSSLNHRLPQISHPQSVFVGTSYNSFSIQLLPIPQNCEHLLSRVYHTTWTGSRWMFEKMDKAWNPQATGQRCRQRREKGQEGSSSTDTSCSQTTILVSQHCLDE